METWPCLIPAGGVATLFFDEDLFDADEDIDGVYAVTPDLLRLTTTNNSAINGTSFQPGDVIEYTISTDTATLMLSDAVFSNTADINGISAVPEPRLVTDRRAHVASSCSQTTSGLGREAASEID